jgi:ATPase subunit of ABC transporter with duplicated ATPase domains
MAQYIYTMIGVSKTVPPDRTIIKDISLSFFPGAKIGLLGLNGAGKSTVLRIMAGVDPDFDGEARPQPGIRIGYLPQEPMLDDEKSVRETVEEGVAEVRDILTRFDEISMKFAEPMDDDAMTALLAEQAELQEAIEHANGWELERTLEVAADALRLPDWSVSISHLSGGERRRVALCRLLLSGLNGSSNWTGATAFPGKVTIPRGWSRKKRG